MLKGISLCLPIWVFWVYVQPLPTLLYPSTSHPPFSTAFNTHPYILYFHRCYVLWYYWCSIIVFSFPSFPEFLRVVPLLQTCSTSEFVYDRACFCVYVYLWIIHMWEKTCNFCFFEHGLLHLLSSYCSLLPLNHVIILYGSVILHCS
jgi:hypothetical protein